MQQATTHQQQHNPQPSFQPELHATRGTNANPRHHRSQQPQMNLAHALMAKAFKLNYSTPTNNNQRISSNPRNRQIAQPGMNMGQDRQMRMVGANGGNQFRQYAGRTELLIKSQMGMEMCSTRLREEAGIQLQAKEFDLMDTAADLDEIEEVNANCILMANLQQASTSGTHTDKAPIYASDGSAKFAKQSILGKPPSASRPKLYAVPTLPNSTAFPKVGETNALSNPVTSNSVPSSRESTVVNNERVIAPGIFRINPFKANRYVNGMKSRKKNQSANVSKSANQKKHKAQILPLVWSPTGRFFDLQGKIITSSESESQSDFSKGDNAFTSNPQEPINKRFPSSTFSMSGCQKWFDTMLIPLLSEYNLEDKEDHGDMI
ncbi:hypothetical protein Tco_1209909 [Tanacetum coccineum]